MMNMNVLYVMEVEGNVTYYNNQYNRASAYNDLLIKKAWLTGKIKMYEVNIANIYITLEDGTKINAKEIK